MVSRTLNILLVKTMVNPGRMGVVGSLIKTSASMAKTAGLNIAVLIVGLTVIQLLIAPKETRKQMTKSK